MNVIPQSFVLFAALLAACGHGSRSATPPALDGGSDARAERMRDADATPAADARVDATAGRDAGMIASRRLYAVESKNVDLRGIALDGESLWWTDSDSALWRGDREGRMPAEKVVDVTLSAGFIVVDEAAVYWTNVGKMVKWDKRSGEKRDLAIGRELLAPRVIQDERNLYVFEAGCRSISIVPKDGTPADVYALPAGSSGSVSAAEQDEDFVYCGNHTSSGGTGTQSPSVYRRPKAGGPAELVSTFSELDATWNPEIYAVVKLGDTLHVALGSQLPPVGDRYEHFIYTVPVAGGAHTRGVGPLAYTLQADGTMACDQARSACWYWSVSGRVLMAYHFKEARVEALQIGIPAYGGGPVQDDQALYFPGRDGIYRLDKLALEAHAN